MLKQGLFLNIIKQYIILFINFINNWSYKKNDNTTNFYIYNFSTENENNIIKFVNSNCLLQYDMCF